MVKNFNKEMPKAFPWETGTEYQKRMQARINKKNERRRKLIGDIILTVSFVLMCSVFTYLVINHKENYWVENPGHVLIDGLYCHEHCVDDDFCEICQEVLEW